MFLLTVSFFLFIMFPKGVLKVENNERVIRRSLVDQVYNLIIKKIQTGEYKPGDRLNIEEIAHGAGVSRTPVREAINRLTQNGFVISVHNVGPKVAVLDNSKIEELCIANSVILEGIIDLIFDSGETEKLCSELQIIVDRQRNAMAEGDLELFYDMSIRFHEAIFNACGNRTLREFGLSTQTRLDVFVLSYQKDESNRTDSLRDHEEILHYFKENDRDGVKESLHRHDMRPISSIN